MPAKDALAQALMSVTGSTALTPLRLTPRACLHRHLLLLSLHMLVTSAAPSSNVEGCPVVLPSWNLNRSVDMCFSSAAVASQYFMNCETSSSENCLRPVGAGRLTASIHPAHATCVSHFLADAAQLGVDVIEQAELSTPGCPNVSAPVLSITRHASLSSWQYASDSRSYQGHLSLHFSRTIKAATRAQWTLENADVIYATSRNASVHLGVHFRDLQKPAVLSIPQQAVQDAFSGAHLAAPITLQFAPDIPMAVVASVNGAAALTALLGSATPLRIARSILHSQFLSWTGSLAVPAIPALYRTMVCNARVVQCLRAAHAQGEPL
jgi:hypothetical protein